MIARGLRAVKDNLLVIRMGVAGLTQWGSSWWMERVCGRGGIRKNCGNLWKSQKSLHAKPAYWPRVRRQMGKIQKPRNNPRQILDGEEKMKKPLWFVLLLSMLTPGLAMAQSAFDGTWKVDIKTAKFPTKPDVYLLQDGMYHCKTCAPPVDVKADGQDQKVGGHPYYDTKSVKVVDDRTIEETDKKNGKVVVTSKTWVSADGNTLMFEFTDSSATNADPVTGKGEAMRVAKGPEGSHAISGSWRASKMDAISDNGVLFTYKVAGDSLTMTTPTGQSYTAKLDGTAARRK